MLFLDDFGSFYKTFLVTLGGKTLLAGNSYSDRK
jgi:hypothetical protein